MSLMSIGRRAAVAAAAAGLLLGTAACGSDGSGSENVVDWWHIQPEDTELGQTWRALAEEFNADHPDGAQIQITSMENDAFKQSLATSMQGGEPPDLFQSWGGGVLRQQAEAGQVMDLTDVLADVIDDIAPGALAPYTVDGRVYGLPFNMGMVGFWYNRDLFEQAGITEEPETWEEFLDVVQQLKDAGITPIALGEADRWPGHFWWAYLATRSAGLDALAEAYDNRRLDHPGFVRAGELLVDLIEMEPFQEGYLAVGYEEGDGQAATMGNGEAAMELMGHWAPRASIDWAGLEGEEAEQLPSRRGFFPFPVIEGGNGAITEIFGGGDGLAIAANAPQETVEFVRYIFENYQRVVDAGGIVPVVLGGEDMIDDESLIPVLETLAEGTGFQLYLDQDWPPAVANEVLDAVAALFAGQATPEDVVERINQAWAREG